MAGKLVHFEVPAKDAERATSFYGGLFGWQFQDAGMPGIDYRMTQLGEEMGGAVFPSENAGGGLTVYFAAGDIDGPGARGRELGGQADDKQPIPRRRRLGGCQD